MGWVSEKTFHLLIHGRWSLGRERFDPERIRRILVIRNDNVGDVLCSTPAIRSIRRAFPRAYLAALVVRYSLDAISGNPDLDEVFTYEKAKHRPDRSRWHSLHRQYQVLRGLKEKRFHLAIGLRSAFSWSEAWLVYFTGAPFRLGYAPTRRKDRGYRFFYNLAADPSPGGHEVDKVLHLVERIGIPPWRERLIAAIPEERKSGVDDFLKARGIDPERLVGFHLSSRVPANRWPAEKFAELALRLTRRDRQFVALTWGPGDRAIADRVRALAGERVLLFPTPDFKELGALQERCRAFLSPDGGPMHLAAAVGTPTVGLFGPTDPREWGPWGNGHVALRRGNHSGEIEVEEVYQILRRWIRNGL